ncbi:LacI family transcriptional regulator [Microbacterium protaetiae]|uniref:LacI family transcriptional regulator n=1 Tax=Microbacterium protaetiae TaxID=2509458 RepID=A0A4V0YDD0_9MICO|nr:LacI family DNA-binding transcriptional regulator [Microbacterium protaetiae]QAY60281.1 LacI family transcriptional regulator [Microbacterium protaetiae]
MVTIKDVAREARVSTATVSYVLNETPGQTITPATQQRVRAAAASLGYAPHGVARALREGASRSVLLNVGAALSGHSLDSFIAGMTDELRRHGHSLLISAGSGIPQDAVDALRPRGVVDLDVLLSGASDDHPVFGSAGGQYAGFALHTMTQLTHLAERGHRAVAFGVPSTDDPLAATRLEHADRAARALGMAPIRTLRIDMGVDRAARTESVRALLSDTDVTAVAAYSDDVAFGVLSAVAALGLQVPDDLAVIGFDDGGHGALWDPPLTTVRIHAASFGERAARFALGIDPGIWTQSPSEVVVRATT